MERIYYRISQLKRISIYTIYWFNSLFKKRKIISETDYKNLNIIIKYFKEKHPYSANYSFLRFYADIQRAKKIKDSLMPVNIVKIGSMVMVENVRTDEKLTVRLVFPDEEQLNTFRLSVFSAVGMSLFAQKLGATVSCFEDKSKVQLKIVSIV